MKMKSEKLFSQLWDMSYRQTTPFHLFDATKNSKEFVQKLQLQKKIPVHSGCVNSICWNENGKYLLSGSDDQHLSIVNGYDYSVLAYVRTGHGANIFSAKFLPNSGDTHIVSSSGDGIIIYSNLDRPETSLHNKFDCHRGTAYEIMTIPQDPNTFLSCGEDKTVRWFDIRTKTSCNNEDCKEDVLIYCVEPVTSIAINPLIPYQLAVGCADSSVLIYDRRMLSTESIAGYMGTKGYRAVSTYFTVPEFPHNRRITSLCYSNDGQEMLVSFSSDFIYLFNIKDDMDMKMLPKDFPFLSANARPPIKRLRVRGDWSDTGPDSRPETESGDSQATASTVSLVRRMTDILTRMLNSTSQRRARSSGSHTSSESSPAASSQSEDGDLDLVSDSNIDEIDENNSRQNEVRSNLSTSQPDLHNLPSTSRVSSGDSPGQKLSNLSETNSSAFKKEQSTIPDDHVPGPSGIHSDFKSVISDSSSHLDLPKSDQDSHTSASSKKSEKADLQNDMENAADEASNSCNEAMDQVVHLSSTSSCQGSDAAHFPGQLDSSDVLERGSESETEIAVQSIQPNISVSGESLSPRSHSPSADNEVEFVMEVDAWALDSDTEAQPHTSESVSTSRRSVCDKVRAHVGLTSPDEEDGKMGNDEPSKKFNWPSVKRKYTGHRNARTMIKESTFWGDNFVMSGSDCGHIFIWDRNTTELVMIMEADHHVVNCLQPHPFDPILASSGIDYDIKLWAPLRETPFFDIEKANEIVKRNEIMLEVTKDTITVPASFMFRMLDTLNHIRNGHRHLHRWNRARRSSNADSSNR